MKRAMPWSSQVDVLSSDSSSSDSDSETDGGVGNSSDNKNTTSKSTKEDTLEAKTGRSRSNVIDFKALSEHGYKGGPSILNIRPPMMDEKEPNWSWSTGKEKAADRDNEESYEERQRTRAALAEGERLPNVQTRKDKNISFSQKEKRKRELGQASRGKNYVEEEKRLLRDNGVYSGFDS